MSSFCKSYSHFFSTKNIRILYIESAKTVNEMTLNELVKLTKLGTIRPRIKSRLSSPLTSAATQENGNNCLRSESFRV